MLKVVRRKSNGNYVLLDMSKNGKVLKEYGNTEEDKAIAIKDCKKRANSRNHYAAMRSCGLVKTPYGWE